MKIILRKFEEPNNFLTLRCSVSWNMCNENLKNIYQNTMQDNEQYKEVNIDKEKIYFEELNNSESVNVYYNTNTKQDLSILNRTSRTVPNILKSNSRSHQIFKTDAAKSNCFFEGITDTKQVLVAASKHTVSGNTFAKEIKHKKISRRRKQKLNYMNNCNEPNWNIFSFVDKEKEMLDKNICMSTELKSCTQEKELKHHTNKQDKKQRTVFKNDQERSSMSDHTLTDFTSECQIFSSFEGIDTNNLQDSIDFSSNEIFNKFNYEFYDNNNLDCCTKYIENSDDTYNSFNTKYDSDYIKECDINDNKIDTSEAYWSLTNYEQSEIDVSITRSMIAPEYWNADLSNEKSKCSSNSCCDYCLEDCVSNWITTSGGSMFRKDRLLTETFNDDSQVNLNNSDLHTSNDTYFTDNEDSRTFSPINEIENSLQITDDINSSLTEFLSYSDEKGIKGEIFKEKTYTQTQENNIPVKNLRVKNNKSKSIKKRNQ